MRIAVLGSSGMLGSALTKFLSNDGIEICEFNRRGVPTCLENEVHSLDVTDDSSLDAFLDYKKFDYVLNAIGLIKQLINDESDDDKQLAYKINSDFPAFLNEYSQRTSTPVIQIGTDCVYSGDEGLYNESSNFDCTDVYGRSKVEGETHSKSVMTIRCSIVGNEIYSSTSLLSWFRNLKHKAEINGYTNHYWNGVTTLDFSRVIRGVIRSNGFEAGITHLIPADQVSKYQLLKEFQQAFHRDDITINAYPHEVAINRTLATIYPYRNSNLWTQAGYNDPPTVHEMVQNYARWEK